MTLTVDLDASSDAARVMRGRLLTLVAATSGGDEVLVPEVVGFIRELVSGDLKEVAEAVGYFVLASVLVAKTALVTGMETPVEEFDLDQPDDLDRFRSRQQDLLKIIERVTEEMYRRPPR